MSVVPSLADATARRADNVLPLRHLAAWLVIYGHSFPLGNNAAGAVDVVERWLPGYSASRCAVFLFFAISGYLLTNSLLRHPGVVTFEFLEPIPAGLKRGPMMALLESRIEAASQSMLEPKAALAHSDPA